MVCKFESLITTSYLWSNLTLNIEHVLPIGLLYGINWSYCNHKFRIHSLIYLGQLHVCPRCRAFFSTSRFLKEHMKRQCVKPSDQEKPFKCEYCTNSFRMRHQLARHMMQHTGERPFKCDMCTKTFLSKSHLKRHAVIHKPPVSNGI